MNTITVTVTGGSRTQRDTVSREIYSILESVGVAIITESPLEHVDSDEHEHNVLQVANQVVVELRRRQL